MLNLHDTPIPSLVVAIGLTFEQTGLKAGLAPKVGVILD